VPGSASAEDAAACPSSCDYLEKPAACKSKLEAVLTCAATATFTCNGSKVTSKPAMPHRTPW
jgi:hypothetical protein